MTTTRVSALVAAMLLATALSVRPSAAAENLRLAPDLSFSDDSSSRFPIEGDDLGSGRLTPGRAAVAFFGAAHCWNTNREAERLVALYPTYRDRLSFIVVDVEKPSAEQRDLVARYYRGSIPTLVVLAADGHVVYAEAGETARTRGDTQELARLLAAAAER